MRLLLVITLAICPLTFANNCSELVRRQAYAQAITPCQYQARRGDAIAQSNLGFMHQHGRGVQQDLQRAFYWYQQAANSGRASAQSSLAFLYQKGLGTTQNAEKAMYWYQQAAAGGRSAAQYNLAQLLRQNPSNQLVDARYWFERAALQGHAKAQQWLAYYFQHGYGGEQDLAKAANWYEIAAKQNRAASFVRLGFKYQMLAQDSSSEAADALNQARRWYQKAADLKSEVAALNLASLD